MLYVFDGLIQWWRCVYIYFSHCLLAYNPLSDVSSVELAVSSYLLLILPINLRSIIWLLMMDWSKRGNLNTAALVTIVQCNNLVARCSRQLIGPADWAFVTWDPYAVISLEAVAYS